MDEEDIAFIYGFGIPQEKKINWGIGLKNNHLEWIILRKFWRTQNLNLFILSSYFHRAYLPHTQGSYAGEYGYGTRTTEREKLIIIGAKFCDFLKEYV